MFFLLIGAIGAGFLLILLIGATAPKPPVLDIHDVANDASPLLDLDAEALGKVVAVLLDKMGLELDRAAAGSTGELEIHAINPAPITGGKILVHCLPAPPDTGKVSALRVKQFISAVRSAYVSKGLLFTTGDVPPDARLEGEDAPIEVFDRSQLQALIDTHLGDMDADELRKLQ